MIISHTFKILLKIFLEIRKIGKSKSLKNNTSSQFCHSEYIFKHSTFQINNKNQRNNFYLNYKNIKIATIIKIKITI